MNPALFTSKKDDLILKNDFLMVASRADVARLLEVDEKRLVYALYKNQKRYYKKFQIKKKTGGFRTITAPLSSLKIIQKRLNYILSLVYSPRPSSHGFVPNSGRNIVSNARVHLKAKVILNLDLENFFPSINFGRIRGIFLAKPFSFNKEVSTLLAQICCYEGFLPQGAPTSPIISNFVCFKMDGQLQKLARQYGATYTRYADDLTFSLKRGSFASDMYLQEEVDSVVISKAGTKLTDIITKSDFKINTKKIRIRNRYKRQDVTGITVNTKTNVKRKFIRQVRAMLHACENFSIMDAEKEYYQKYCKNNFGYPRKQDFLKVIEGKINFIRIVRGEKDKIFRKFANQLHFIKGNGYPKYHVDFYDEIKAATWVVKCGNKTGSGFMLEGHGLITCAHNLDNNEPISVWQWDDWVQGGKDAVVDYSEKDLDVAILKFVDIDKFHSLKCGDSKRVKERDLITVSGFPKYHSGDQPLIYDTKVAGRRETKKNRIQRIIIDRPMYSGQSGGPAFNSKDEVVGIIVEGATNVSGSDEISDFGIIPISILENLNKIINPNMTP